MFGWRLLETVLSFCAEYSEIKELLAIADTNLGNINDKLRRDNYSVCQILGILVAFNKTP